MSISQPDRYEDGGIILSNHAKKKLAKELARRSEGETMDSISVQFTRASWAASAHSWASTLRALF
jgi:hypothetical protein